ncbi:glycoside hydrolase family 6 protein [Streptomyces sp. NPDC048269]|uniref:glycoside hydrolase family 6 protein n=1 Tax=Streptomyces sp. NPDC048269 TaxID=3155753 RepID=UPI00342F8FC6
MASSRITAEASSAPVSHTLPTNTRFYVDPDGDAAHQAVTDLLHRDLEGAKSMAKLASWPEAAWFTDGTPEQVESRVRDLVRRAERTRTVPVLVAYNIPLRDCSQYSSGGAQSDAEYQAWISAFARGLGRNKAVVILEPDGLANLPSDCGPDSDPTGAITTGRFADLNHAIDALERQPNSVVYLDAGNSHWRSVGDIAQRLLQAGVTRTQGFSLNVSNWPPTCPPTTAPGSPSVCGSPPRARTGPGGTPTGARASTTHPQHRTTGSRETP